MEDIRLSHRLLAAADAVREGSRVADVGCDHGKLGAHLIITKKSPLVTAIDISEPSLNKAKELFVQLGITERARTLCSDGLSEVHSEDADDVAIAGLGSDTIIKVFCDCRWLRNPDKRLVLVPASHHERLRKGLYAAGFRIERETAVYEDAQYYTIITAVYSGVIEEKNEAFCAVGKLEDKGDGERYINWVYRKNKLLLNLPCSNEKKSAAQSIVRHIEELRR